MTPTPKSASGATALEAVEQTNSQQLAAGPFVLNLCSSTTPLALPRAEQEELKRFSFFVSRRFEEGRERFRLHMGFFTSLAEAEEWLGAVRDIYPGAWAGEAPGKKLRERAAAAAAAQAKHAAGPPAAVTVAVPVTPVVAAPSPRAASVAPTRAASAPMPASTPAPMNVPTIHAAAVSVPHARQIPVVPVAKAAVPPTKPAVTANAPASSRAPASAAPQVLATPQAPARPAVSAKPPVPAKPPVAANTSVPATAPSRAATTKGPVTPAAAQMSARPAGAPVKAPLKVPSAPPAGVVIPTARAAVPTRLLSARQAAKALPNSNVREVLKALDDIAADATGETRLMPAPLLSELQSVPEDSSFTDTQVLRLLETRRADGTELSGSDVESGAISLLKPDDTATVRALKQAVTENAPVWFAVQLQWSVQPVELIKVPPLAIFSAYTLYTVEGSREGRKWFGLRLGFFSDAISAKQVAYYVRSEFTSVAVVPVSPKERERASDPDKKAAGGVASPKKSRSGPVDEFKLIDDGTPRAAPPVLKPAAPAIKRPKPGNVVRARERRAPQTLEETLEILGAGELEIDDGTGENLNESGVRHLRVEVQKNTPFSRLLERLSERVRKA